MGTVYVRQLPVSCIIGIHADERVANQQLLISVELDVDFSRARHSDAVEDALDYTLVAKHIAATARAGRFRLIETLAEKLAEELLTPGVLRVAVDVQKPAALAATREVGVRVERQQQGDPA